MAWLLQLRVFALTNMVGFHNFFFPSSEEEFFFYYYHFCFLKTFLFFNHQQTMLFVSLKKRTGRQAMRELVGLMFWGTVLLVSDCAVVPKNGRHRFADREVLSTLYHLFQYVDLLVAKLKIFIYWFKEGKEIKHISLLLLFPNIWMHIYVCLYGSIYTHIYT